MTRVTILFLVLLRLAIGWHLFYEGCKKVQKGTFTSEDYLRESIGPLAPFFHSIAGDPLADRLTPMPVPTGVDPSKSEEYKYFPPELAKEWDAWFDRFVSHYGLDTKQREDAETKLQQSKSAYVHWLRTSKKTVVKTSAVGPPIPAEQTVQERLDDYHGKQKEVRDFIEHDFRKASGTQFEDEARAQLATLRRDAAAMRFGLRSDIEEQTGEMRRTVSAVLTEEQSEKPLPPARVKPGLLKRNFLGWIDFVVTTALIVFGLCLMLGLLTRTVAVGAALLVLSFYVAMPPFPGLPDPPQTEGNYLIINKNIVEILAMLVLSATASGRWFGLDGVIRVLCQQRAQRKVRPTGPKPTLETAASRSAVGRT
jgi:uncharacterized membrane protein YphA (DoxX/SURF4 family)